MDNVRVGKRYTETERQLDRQRHRDRQKRITDGISADVESLLKAIEISTEEDLISGMIVFVIGTVSIPVSIYITNKTGLLHNRSKSRTIRN